MVPHSCCLVLLGAALSALLVSPAQAQWQPDGVPVCTAAGVQSSPVEVPDGAGGAFIAWQDSDAGGYHIYAQHLDAAGVPQWDARGVLISNPSFPQMYPVGIRDGVGGAILAWVEQHGPDDYIWAQRINSAGALLWWGGAGLAVCQTTGRRSDVRIISDNRSGLATPGAILTWMDQRTATYNLYAQAVDANGNVRWSPLNGVVVSTAAASKLYPVMVTDGVGTIGNPRGAIIAWEQQFSGTSDIYAQRLNASGVPQWGAEGVAVCTNAAAQQAPQLVFTGAGTAIVGWIDARNLDYDIYAQRVGAAGSWQADGVPICVQSSNQLELAMASDGAGGAVFSWSDYRAENLPNLYAQRVDGTGSRLWAPDGILVCTATGNQVQPVMLADFAGGALCGWVEVRNLAGDLYVQHVDGAGGLLWNPGGLPICLAPEQPFDVAVVGDDAGGAILAWGDARTGGNSDLYAQHVSASGVVVGIAAGHPRAFQSIEPFPNPSARAVTLKFELPGERRVDAEVLDLGGRVVAHLADGRNFPPGAGALSWDGLDGSRQRVAAGVYFVRVRAGDEVRGCRVLILR